MHKSVQLWLSLHSRCVPCGPAARTATTGPSAVPRVPIARFVQCGRFIQQDDRFAPVFDKRSSPPYYLIVAPVDRGRGECVVRSHVLRPSCPGYVLTEIVASNRNRRTASDLSPPPSLPVLIPPLTLVSDVMWAVVASHIALCPTLWPTSTCVPTRGGKPRKRARM